MTAWWWDELSTGELAARLINRGWSEDSAYLVARNREAYHESIVKELGHDED